MMRRRSVQGQVIVETVLSFVLVIAAVLFLKVYIQRAIQGNTYQGAESLGIQFNPEQAYTEVETLNKMQDRVNVVTVTSAIQAPLLPGPKELPSIPTGQVPRETATAQSTMTANWDIHHEADYATPR